MFDDQNKKQGFPRKDRKFHFVDPFIYNVISNWLTREGQINKIDEITINSIKVEASVASTVRRFNKTFYFKGQGEIDVISLKDDKIYAIEVKWAEQIRPADSKMLKQFKNSFVLTKNQSEGSLEHIQYVPVYKFLFDFVS